MLTHDVGVLGGCQPDEVQLVVVAGEDDPEMKNNVGKYSASNAVSFVRC